MKKVCWVGVFIDGEDFVWGILTLERGRYEWSGVNVERRNERDTLEFVGGLVGEMKIHPPADVIVGDSRFFKVNDGIGNIRFVLPHLNAALWLLLWEYSRSSYKVGINLHVAASQEEVLRKCAVREKDGRIHIVKLRDLLCDCREKWWTKPEGGGICEHIIAAMKRVSHRQLMEWLNDIQRKLLGEVWVDFVGGIGLVNGDNNGEVIDENGEVVEDGEGVVDREEGREIPPTQGGSADLGLPDFSHLTSLWNDVWGHDEFAAIPSPPSNPQQQDGQKVVVLTCHLDGEFIFEVLLQKIDGNIYVGFRWEPGGEVVGRMKLSDELLLKVLRFIVGLVVNGKDVGKWRREVMVFLAGIE